MKSRTPDSVSQDDQFRHCQENIVSLQQLKGRLKGDAEDVMHVVRCVVGQNLRLINGMLQDSNGRASLLRAIMRIVDAARFDTRGINSYYGLLT